MPLSDPTDVLLAHDRWATHQVLDACAGLTDEQFRQTFAMGPGSLHATIAHILGAIQGWTDFLAEREVRDRIEQGSYTVDELKAMLDELSDEFEAIIRAHPLDGRVGAERGGRRYEFIRGAVLTHVTTHGMHHRAQCLNMLRQLGVDPLPQNSVLHWMIARNMEM